MKLGAILVRIPRKVKAGQVFKVMSITKHPMDTGLVKNPKTGKIIPMWIINKVEIYYDKKLITTCDYGIAISANPFLAFYLKADKKAPLEIVEYDTHHNVYKKTVMVNVV